MRTSRFSRASRLRSMTARWPGLPRPPPRALCCRSMAIGCSASTCRKWRCSLPTVLLRAKLHNYPLSPSIANVRSGQPLSTPTGDAPPDCSSAPFRRASSWLTRSARRALRRRCRRSAAGSTAPGCRSSCVPTPAPRRRRMRTRPGRPAPRSAGSRRIAATGWIRRGRTREVCAGGALPVGAAVTFVLSPVTALAEGLPSRRGRAVLSAGHRTRYLSQRAEGL